MQLQFNTQLRNIEARMESLETSITNKINKNIEEKFFSLKTDVENLNHEQVEQDKRLDFVEKQLRIRNLIIFGVKEEEKSYKELETLLIGIIKGNLEIDLSEMEIEFVKRIGKPNHEKTRPILFAVTTLGKKIDILKNKKKLIGTNSYIKEDYPKKIQEIRRSLQPLLEHELEQGNRAVIKYDKLVIIGKNTQKRQLSQSPCLEKDGNVEHTQELPKEPKSKKTKSSEQQRSITYYGSTKPKTPTHSIKTTNTPTTSSPQNRNTATALPQNIKK
ncbi:unnamed protein product [Plutella xylostella]|uniref:(diamondback moth) hypothetical protein n=1 Tax=Plutella xylostella TaxID=51655 RepID=A0A8S4DQH0_PLUXY|nr:unnamed protein product [Plutella xylostella]